MRNMESRRLQSFTLSPLMKTYNRRLCLLARQWNDSDAHAPRVSVPRSTVYVLRTGRLVTQICAVARVARMMKERKPLRGDKSRWSSCRWNILAKGATADATIARRTTVCVTEMESSATQLFVTVKIVLTLLGHLKFLNSRWWANLIARRTRWSKRKSLEESTYFPDMDNRIIFKAMSSEKILSVKYLICHTHSSGCFESVHLAQIWLKLIVNFNLTNLTPLSVTCRFISFLRHQKNTLVLNEAAK